MERKPWHGDTKNYYKKTVVYEKMNPLHERNIFLVLSLIFFASGITMAYTIQAIGWVLPAIFSLIILGAISFSMYVGWGEFSGPS